MLQEELEQMDHPIAWLFVIYLIAATFIVGFFVVAFDDVVIKNPLLGSIMVVVLAVVMTMYEYGAEWA